jgi:DNA-binding transcriptional ArsR family regulator
MSSQDVILIHPKIIQLFPEEEVEEVLADKNHRKVLQFLYKKPLTVEELVDCFKAEGHGKGKDRKTIYRYLLNLKKSNLVIEAGKRFESSSAKGKTLFGRAAQIIYVPSRRFDQNDELERKSFEILNLMLQEKLGYKNTASIENLRETTQELKIAKNKVIEDYFRDNKNPEILKLLSDFEIHELIPILDLAGWIFLFEERPEMIKEVLRCFK